MRQSVLRLSCLPIVVFRERLGVKHPGCVGRGGFQPGGIPLSPFRPQPVQSRHFQRAVCAPLSQFARYIHSTDGYNEVFLYCSQKCTQIGDSRNHSSTENGVFRGMTLREHCIIYFDVKNSSPTFGLIFYEHFLDYT